MSKLHDPRREKEARTEEESRKLQVRTGVLVGIFGAILLAFVVVLYQTQIVHGEDYLASANYSVQEVETVDSVRGEILDRYGRVLVTNSVQYNVTLDTTLMGEERNEILSSLLALCREQGVEWTDSLPVSDSAPWSYTRTESLFSYESEDEDGNTAVYPTNLGRLAENRGWIEEAETADVTAEELLRAMAGTFGLEIGEDAAVSQEDRQLMGVLYELYLRAYDVVSSEYVFARDVDIAFISTVKEQSLTGVEIETDTSRTYNTSSAAHVLGYTGSITTALWPTYQELGYPMDAVVGRDGAELAFEEYLHGTSGRRRIETDDNGKIVTQEWEEEPDPGDNVVLTLDIGLQAVTEQYLADFIESLENPAGGAAVVMDMTGGVLAMASYPTYDLGDFNYGELASDTERNPLLNRATQGIYAPGSTFKMVSAVAGLSSGVIDLTTRVECTGYYRYYDTTQRCWIAPGRHGLENVTQAITDSCNIFFYDTAAKMGIATLQDYAQQFGLGEYTGIEISESRGRMAGPEAAEALGQTWYGGEVLSAAIGQSLSQFTPIQLANYVATLANGGNHYQAHLLKEVKSDDYSQVVYEYEPVLLNSIDIDQEDLDAVLQGMYDLSQTASMARYFASLPVSVGCKTGTAEVGTGVDATATFTCFAPYDDPEIVIYLVAEHGSSGGNLAEVAAGILAQYFSTEDAQSAPTQENTLIR